MEKKITTSIYIDKVNLMKMRHILLDEGRSLSDFVNQGIDQYVNKKRGKRDVRTEMDRG